MSDCQVKYDPELREADYGWVLSNFPNANHSNIELVAPRSRSYNCFANALGVEGWLCGSIFQDNHEYMWDLCEVHGWAMQIDMGLGLDFSVEPGVHKIMFYHNGHDVTHGAKQMPDGRWESKLGSGPKAVHTVDALDDSVYGKPWAVFTKRAG